MAVPCIVSGTADTSASIVVESLGQIPAGWMLAREANPNQNIRLRIALEQPNLDIFEQTLYSISTPQHPQYGRHLSRDELAESMSPIPLSFHFRRFPWELAFRVQYVRRSL